MTGVRATMVANTIGLTKMSRVIKDQDGQCHETGRDVHSGQVVHGGLQPGSAWFTSDQEPGWPRARGWEWQRCSG